MTDTLTPPICLKHNRDTVRWCGWCGNRGSDHPIETANMRCEGLGLDGFDACPIRNGHGDEAYTTAEMVEEGVR